jgi:hypothetical protein
MSALARLLPCLQLTTLVHSALAGAQLVSQLRANDSSEM